MKRCIAVPKYLMMRIIIKTLYEEWMKCMYEMVVERFLKFIETIFQHSETSVNMRFHKLTLDSKIIESNNTPLAPLRLKKMVKSKYLFYLCKRYIR